jgi:hypothetical protein
MKGVLLQRRQAEIEARNTHLRSEVLALRQQNEALQRHVESTVVSCGNLAPPLVAVAPHGGPPEG